MVICLERGADLHMAQLMPVPLTVSCFSEIQIGFTVLLRAHPGCPGKRAVKRVCVFFPARVSFICRGSPLGNKLLWVQSSALPEQKEKCQGTQIAVKAGICMFSPGVDGLDILTLTVFSYLTNAARCMRSRVCVTVGCPSVHPTVHPSVRLVSSIDSGSGGRRRRVCY